MTEYSPVEPDGILAIVTSNDDATAVAIRDAAIRRYSVICSTHQRVYSFYYTPGNTEADHKKFSDDIALAAAKHATTRHTATHDATRGETS